jgi:hypothetical protein
MSLINACPLPAALVSVPETTCAVRFDQISKIAFQKIQTTPSFTTTTILVKATWTPLLAASDDTKLVLSPLLNNLVIPASELNAEGGNDNTTIGGVRNVKGLNGVTPTAKILNISDATKQAIQGLFEFSKSPAPGATMLWAYFLTTDGHVIFKKNGTNCEGIEVYNVCLGDPGSEGFNKDNEHNFSFDLLPGWSDGVEMLKLTDFKALTLKNPS